MLGIWGWALYSPPDCALGIDVIIEFNLSISFNKNSICVFISIFSGVAEGQECDDPGALDFGIVIEAGLKMFGPSHVI